MKSDVHDGEREPCLDIQLKLEIVMSAELSEHICIDSFSKLLFQSELMPGVLKCCLSARFEHAPE